MEANFLVWIKDRRRIAKLGAGALALSFLVWMGLSSPESAPGEKQREQLDLEPGSFVITETSWGADESAQEVEGQTLYGDSFMSEEEKQRVEEAKERWQNLDIAVRRQR